MTRNRWRKHHRAMADINLPKVTDSADRHHARDRATARNPHRPSAFPGEPVSIHVSRCMSPGPYRYVQVMLRGREVQQAAINALLSQARAGASGALVLRGEPGIGKTALLDYS